MNSNRFSARSGESTNGGGTVLNALVSGGRGMQRASSEASVTGGRANSGMSVTGGLGSVAPIVQAVNALNNAVNAASSTGSFSPGRSVASSTGNFSPGRMSAVGNNNRSNNNNNNNIMNMLMNMNDDELAALEHFAMSPGTPQHRNKRARK